MILPGKHLRQDRALLGVGAEFTQLDEPRSVSELWERVRAVQSASPNLAPLSFDWFILSLNLLYVISALDFENGLLSARSSR